MLRRCLILLPVLLLAFVASASADDGPDSRLVPRGAPQKLEQTIYKGFVGNVLDAIPMDPAKRVNLQRTNAIISNTVSGRSFAELAGLSNPVLLIGGLVWGVWAASNIKPEEAGANVSAETGDSGGKAPKEERLAALLDSSDIVNDGTVNPVHEPISAGRPVIRIWLPQRSTVAQR